jgi:two-component system OmpR family response regulator
MTQCREAESEKPAQGLRILCVEDDAGLALLLEHALRRAGHEVECAADADFAFSRIAADPARYHLVITDHSMPPSTGLRLVQRLRALNFPGKILVHCSPLPPADEATYRRLAVDGILPKPSRLEDLIATVQKLS